MAFCRKCGSKLADDAVFCSACGEKVDSTPKVASSTEVIAKEVSVVDEQPMIEVYFKNDYITPFYTPMKVYLDGEQIGTVGKGCKEKFEVPTGLHELKVSVFLVGRSREYSFKMNNGDFKRLTVRNSVTPLSCMLLYAFLILICSFGKVFEIKEE